MGVSLGDLDGDGDLDVAVADYGSLQYYVPGEVTVRLNKGDGTFAALQRYVAGAGSTSVSLGDLDGDGDLDMAVANRGPFDNYDISGDVSVLFNNGNGTFAARQPYAAGDHPNSASLGDLDGDGDLDMAVTNGNNADVSVLLNNGDGTFAAQQRYAAGAGPVSVALADLDDDGDLDMAIANSGSGDASILFNNGDGSFAAQQRYAAGIRPKSVSLGDLDGDSDLDVAIVNTGAYPDYIDDASVLLNNGDGTFAAQQRYATGRLPSSVSLGDLDGDGDLDMTVANAYLSLSNVSVLLNNGDGTFADQQHYAAGDGPESISLGDLDGDGDLDMAVANWYSQDVSVLLNTSGPCGCNPADLAQPFGTLDLADIVAFVTAFANLDPAADLAEPFGTFDLADLVAFIQAFGAGCP
ncbi:MAG: VCBS repeat-containing protein [Phycisphaeraceae bacterium]|nr:MAG: VCBS repeat-containing protein [Phycisphaeraceae bacterium]